MEHDGLVASTSLDFVSTSSLSKIVDAVCVEVR